MSDTVIILEPGRTEKHYWRDLWHYRELFQVLAARDISVRYKQTLIGAFWAVIRPVLTMVVFTIVFGKLAKLPSDGNAPYPLMVFAAMLPWQFFATALVAFVDFLISFVILGCMMVYYQFVPGWQFLLLPFFSILAFAASLGPGLWITSLNVKYRDFRYVIPFLIQFGLYLSPVGFSSSIVPEKWKLLYSLNPMVGVIDGFRWCILGDESPIDWTACGLSLLVTIVFLIVGIRQFRKMEKTFADLV